MVVNIDDKREQYARQDGELLDKLIDMRGDMITGIDLIQTQFPERIDNQGSLVQYEKLLADTIERLKQLSPHLK